MHSPACRQCGKAFDAVRSDAKFCSAACRQAMSRRYVPINRTSSPTKRRREDELFDLHYRLCETYYGMHPNARPFYLEGLIDRAIEGEAKVQAVLTNPILVRSHLGPGGDLQKRYHFRGCFAYPTLPFEAHRFTMYTWGVTLFDCLRTPPGVLKAIARETADELEALRVLFQSIFEGLPERRAA